MDAAILQQLQGQRARVLAQQYSVLIAADATELAEMEARAQIIAGLAALDKLLGVRRAFNFGTRALDNLLAPEVQARARRAGTKIPRGGDPA